MKNEEEIIEQLQRKLKEVQKHLALSEAQFTQLERVHQKLKSKYQRIEEDNIFLKSQVKTKLAENESLKLALESICDFIKNEKASVKFQEDSKTNEKILSRIKQIARSGLGQKVSFGNFLENSFITLQNPTEDSKKKNKLRSITPLSTKPPTIRQKSPIERENTIVCNLQNQNRALKKRLLSLRTKHVTEITQKNEIEDVFLDCFEEAKRIVYKRRLKIMDNRHFRAVDPKIKLSVTQDVTSTLQKIDYSVETNKIKSTDLTPEDKLNLVTLFICNENVMVHIFRLLFPRMGTQLVPSLESSADAQESRREHSAGRPRYSRLNNQRSPLPPLQNKNSFFFTETE